MESDNFGTRQTIEDGFVTAHLLESNYMKSVMGQIKWRVARLICTDLILLLAAIMLAQTVAAKQEHFFFRFLWNTCGASWMHHQHYQMPYSKTTSKQID